MRAWLSFRLIGKFVFLDVYGIYLGDLGDLCDINLKNLPEAQASPKRHAEM